MFGSLVLVCLFCAVAGLAAQAGDHLVQSVGGDGPSTTLYSHTPGDGAEGTNAETVNVTPRRQGVASRCFSWFLLNGGNLRIQGDQRC